MCIYRKSYYTANIGDTRAVLVRGDDGIRITKDHKPYVIEEEERIKSIGGYVADGRVNGKLAISRVLGDFHLRPYVICDPFVDEIKLTSDDKYLIIACDGLWDMLTDKRAAEICQRQATPSRASAVLRDFAYMLGSDDNISVIVVKF